MGTCGPSGYYVKGHDQKGQYHIKGYRLLQVVGEGDSVPHCNWMRRCAVDTAFDLALA